MSICQLGMHKNVQDHTNANVCKQTYDASCTLLSHMQIWHMHARHHSTGLQRYAGMQVPQKEIFDICKPLLVTRSLADVEAIVDKVFTDDAVFTHALIIAKGKKSIARTYQFWNRSTERLLTISRELVRFRILN